MLIKACFFLINIFTVFSVFSQKVSDATSRQEQSNIIVSYHLKTELPCTISLFVSTDGGKNWTGPLKKVKGDVGNKVFGGDYTIEWSVLEEYNELIGDNIKFQVRAESNVADFGTVKIGNQVWTTSNLDVSTYRNGDEIPEVSDPKKWSKLTTGAWCHYENKTKNGISYGKLYNWYAINDPRGLAPEGYHIPSDTEWTFLTDYLGTEPGKKMKSQDGWATGDNGNNKSGFSGLPGGFRFSDGSFHAVRKLSDWWSSTEVNTNNAMDRNLYFNSRSVGRSGNAKNCGFTVRCLKD
jgi:uncharacterized protein (TIGR02145 family)